MAAVTFLPRQGKVAAKLTEGDVSGEPSAYGTAPSTTDLRSAVLLSRCAREEFAA